MSSTALIALTGGPGGGKTTLIDELQRNPAWAGSFAVLPGAISPMPHVGSRLGRTCHLAPAFAVDYRLAMA
jgi:putative protein kinase ArgK-like GTPase of G3E family